MARRFMLKQSQLAEGIASLRFTSIAMTSLNNWFLEWTHDYKFINHHATETPGYKNMKKPKLLLHTCCAPCVTVPLERLQHDYEVSCFFYNPNIHLKDEYLKRLNEVIRLTKELELKIVIPEYDVARWFELVKGLEDEPEGGERCAVCFEMRLQETAKYAKKHKFESFTTTLTISPHKNAALINQIGTEISEQNQIPFLEANFKKQDGFRRSIELSKKYNLYRQKYCGCIFSRGVK